MQRRSVRLWPRAKDAGAPASQPAERPFIHVAADEEPHTAVFALCRPIAPTARTALTDSLAATAAIAEGCIEYFSPRTLLGSVPFNVLLTK